MRYTRPLTPVHRGAPVLKAPVETSDDFMLFVRHAEHDHGIPDWLMRDTWKAPSENARATWLLPGKVAEYGSDWATPWLHITADL